MRKEAVRKKKRNYFTLMVLPHGSAQGMITFKIPTWAAYTVLIIVLSSLLTLGVSFTYSSALTRRLFNYWSLYGENARQKEALTAFSQQTHELRWAIEELTKRDNELRRLLGLKIKEKKAIPAAFNPDRARLAFVDRSGVGRTGKIEKALLSIFHGVKARKESFKDLKEKVARIRARFAATPSIWPAYGRISSGFGYRTRPWRGFHRGLDIVGWQGAPIKAAADGIITYAGWVKGYGLMIKVDHGYGTATLYGHCSRSAVGIGTRVKKGQVIASMGKSGWATGPHLHYEVRKFRKSVNPAYYLNLDIFTASRIWKY